MLQQAHALLCAIEIWIMRDYWPDDFVEWLVYRVEVAKEGAGLE
jgi:hypothetical protein